MDAIRPLAAPQPRTAPTRLPTGATKAKGKHVVEVKDPKTKQSLRIWSDEPLQAFILDNGKGQRREGEKVPDAVIVGEAPSGSFVLFIDLTMSMKPRTKKEADTPTNPTAHKLAQLLDGMKHFHPHERKGGERSHGDDHHDAWSRQEDLPDVAVDSDHRVGGLGIGFHHTARALPRCESLGGKNAIRAVWSPVPSGRGEADVTLDQIFRNLGWQP